MRSFSLVLSLLVGCSDYEINSISAEEPTTPPASASDVPADELEEVDNTCQPNSTAFIQAEVISLGQDMWIPGWNEIAKFTLTTDKDTCYDATVSFDFTSTDNAGTGWNACEMYDGQDRLRIFHVTTDDNGEILEELDANWAFQGATGDNGAYVHYCEAGRFIVNAMPTFVDEDTTLLAGNPLTFVVMMEAEGSTDPEDRMRVDLLWDDSSQVGTNSGNLHQREGDMLPFTE